MTEALVRRGPEGSITVTAAALTRVVARAAAAEGAPVRRPKRAIEVAHDSGRATVTLQLSAPYGEPLPQLARAVQERVAAALAALSGLEVEHVHLEIQEVV